MLGSDLVLVFLPKILQKTLRIGCPQELTQDYSNTAYTSMFQTEYS